MSNNLINRLANNIEKVIIGKRHSVELALVSLMCRGHVLIEDVPGVGKTSLVAALAKSIDGSFNRIQFTPDIMPTDITGFSVYNPKSGEFEYKQGVIMSQFILADEINRTSPKTQSSLLEVMEENQVTVDGITYAVPMPFMVLATQNPIEYLGTYPLPEAQLDRFFMKISLGYPSKLDESKMLSRFKKGSPLDELEPIATGNEVVEYQDVVESIYVSREINEYIVSLVSSTRSHEDVILGASPRGSLCLQKAAQAWACYTGRDFVIPDDVTAMAVSVLEHRILIKQEAKYKGSTAAKIIEDSVKKIPAPQI